MTGVRFYKDNTGIYDGGIDAVIAVFTSIGPSGPDLRLTALGYVYGYEGADEPFDFIDPTSVYINLQCCPITEGQARRLCPDIVHVVEARVS